MEQALPTQVANLLNLRGQIASMTTVRECKVRKGNLPVTKQSTFTCRVGVTYDNIRVVQEKRESGELPAENAGLPWGRWAVFPYVIVHGDEWYFRCTNLLNGRRSSTYYQGGREISREEAREQCLASEFRDSNSDVFNVKVSSIVIVNREAVAA